MQKRLDMVKYVLFCLDLFFVPEWTSSHGFLFAVWLSARRGEGDAEVTAHSSFLLRRTRLKDLDSCFFYRDSQPSKVHIYALIFTFIF